MRKLFVFFLIVLWSLTAAGAQADDQNITISLPEAVLKKTIQAVLPLDLNQQSETLSGAIIIQRIDNLQIEQGVISARIGLNGQNLKLTTNLAGQNIQLKVGDVQVNSDVSASLRYDPKTETLYLVPSVTPLGSQENKQNDELANLLAGLLNNREFPIKIDKFKPIVTDTGSKRLIIDMKLTGVRIVPDKLLLDFSPNVHLEK